MKKYFFLFLCLFTGVCQDLFSESIWSSTIDSRYRLKRIEQNIDLKGVKSEGVSFYQKILSQTLGSHCNFFPNDSHYSQITFKNCGKMKAILKSMERFYLEPDASSQWFDIMLSSEKIRYVHLPKDCNF